MSDHGKITQVVAKAFTAEGGLPAVHLRAATSSLRSMGEMHDPPGPRLIPARSPLGHSKRDRHFSEVTR